MMEMIGPFMAEDAAQDVFNKVHKGLAGFKGKSRLSTWIYRIATNTAIDKTRRAAFKHERAGSHAGVAGEDAGKRPSCREKTIEQKIIKQEMNDCIRQFIDRLPMDDKTIIVLSRYEHRTPKEIAGILGISQGTAKIRLHRAKAKLKKALDHGCRFYHDDQNTLCCDRKPPAGSQHKAPQ